MNSRPVTVKKHSHTGLATAILFVWLGLIVAAFFNQQYILDWWRLRGYEAPTVVAALATDDTMTSSARHIFYVNKPAVEDKAAFTQCRSNSEQTIVLGCYHSDQQGIFVLAVSDSRLNGVEQVTAAHEMLHAAYDRLNSRDKQTVNRMLEDYYNHSLHDQRIIDTIAAYKKSEPHDVVNEMHSIFGTEVADLPSGLEQYYKRYFNDRSKVTGFAAQYQAEFTSRQAAIKQYDVQLTNLKAQIDQLETDLKAQLSALNEQGTHLQALRNSNNIAAYNAGVPSYNVRVDAYNAEVARVKDLISQYNQLVTSRNAVVLETQQLTNEISTQVAPIGH